MGVGEGLAWLDAMVEKESHLLETDSFVGMEVGNGRVVRKRVVVGEIAVVEDEWGLGGRWRLRYLDTILIHFSELWRGINGVLFGDRR